MNMQTVLILLGIATVMMGLITSILIVYIIHKDKKEDIDLKKKMFEFSLPINTEDNLNILDRLVNDEVTTYTIYHFPYSDDLYITEKDQKKMIQYILKEVLKKISPVYMSKLEYIYNKDIIEDIIFSKVRDSVLRYSIEINGSFREKN